MNRKDILFRRRLMAIETRPSKASYLLSQGAWLPTIRFNSNYYSSYGYYYIGWSSLGHLGHGEIIYMSYYLNSIVLEAGHSYLVNVQLSGYTPYYDDSSYNFNIRIISKANSANVVAYIFKRYGNDTITSNMTDSFLDNNYSYGDLQAFEAYSTTPFTMYFTIKKIS